MANEPGTGRLTFCGKEIQAWWVPALGGIAALEAEGFSICSQCKGLL